MCSTIHLIKGLLFLILCSFFTASLSQQIQSKLDEIPELTKTIAVQPLSQFRTTALEDTGIIQVVDGSACGESNRSGSENAISLQGSYDLPDYATDATVFLNGWDTRYLSSDHHIGRVASIIRSPQLESSRLTWEAIGLLRDKNFDDGYRWCYYYTVIAWNRNRIDARVLGARDNTTFSFYNDNEHVALVSAAGFLNSNFLSGDVKAAVLPRGFVYGWEEGFSQADHHLLQIAYNLDHSETFLQAGRNWSGPAPNVTNSQASRFVSWETHGIFKDNSAKRDFRFGSAVSILAGRGIETKQPPFIIIPKEDYGNCGELGGDVITQEHVIENVPYDYAIPVLTAWELRYPCKDHHVKRLGVWLHDISYEKAPTSLVGTLRYSISSILRDKDRVPLHIPRHKITLLGMNSTPPRPIPVPD
ncbi:hypothetical protein SCO11_09050 [Legionella pneumophila serogroup 1]|uniref:hypothetical protein n=1 Tax=Legionella pneumophila TaxID=446 RepID=UPI0005B3F112|nr:hypothetical protein [Legionella pneumophila]AMV12801.1 hypothetical protein ULM_00980 [Legionella pneumophila]ANN91180.1 hypothetical protein A9P85_00480 [Legionella pneumophila]MCZ4677457.1 hypothetical protein [Legionella pneumophila]MCZ4703216.1 hypothetical protein [Legionella pneumophila]MCZ4749632.1 hypothetical protein [Legionella pneumophila]